MLLMVFPPIVLLKSLTGKPPQRRFPNWARLRSRNRTCLKSHAAAAIAVAVVENFEFRVILDFGGQIKPVFERGEKGVALDIAFDEGEKEVGALGEGLRIELGSAANENLSVACEGG